MLEKTVNLFSIFTNAWPLARLTLVHIASIQMLTNNGVFSNSKNLKTNNNSPCLSMGFILNDLVL